MRRINVVIAIMAAASIMTSRADAQLIESVREREEATVPVDKELDDEGNRRLMYTYGACIVRRHKMSVIAYLDSVVGSVEAFKKARWLATNDCLQSGEMRFNEPLFRAAAYDALYNLQYHKSGPQDFSSVAPIDYAIGRSMIVYANATRHIALRQIADCTVRHGPAHARALILTRIASGQEKEAFAALVPDISGCLHSDETMHFSRLILRAMIGETLYRLSVRAPAQPG